MRKRETPDMPSNTNYRNISRSTDAKREAQTKSSADAHNYRNKKRDNLLESLKPISIQNSYLMEGYDDYETIMGFLGFTGGDGRNGGLYYKPTTTRNNVVKYYDKDALLTELGPFSGGGGRDKTKLLENPDLLIPLSDKVNAKIQEKQFRVLNDYIIQQQVIDIQKVADASHMERITMYNKYLLERITDIYFLQEKLLDSFERKQKTKGRQIYYGLTVPISANSTVKIDFTNSAGNKNMPVGTGTIKGGQHPNTPLFSLIVKVDAGGPVYISTNESDDSMDAYVKLTANEEQKLEDKEGFIKSVNIRAETVQASVRVIGLY